MNWCFAKVNNRLVELFFEKKNGKTIFIGHAYVKESEYKTKKEKNWIKKDSAKFQFIYRKGEYKKFLRKYQHAQSSIIRQMSRGENNYFVNTFG